MGQSQGKELGLNDDGTSDRVESYVLQHTTTKRENFMLKLFEQLLTIHSVSKSEPLQAPPRGR
jgi:hypothetical protein